MMCRAGPDLEPGPASHTCCVRLSCAGRETVARPAEPDRSPEDSVTVIGASGQRPGYGGEAVGPRRRLLCANETDSLPVRPSDAFCRG